MKTIKIIDKKFCESITASELQERVKQLADEINRDYEGCEVDFIIILNGAFIFAGDLLRHINLNCRTMFVRLSSYEGMWTTGVVKQIIGLDERLVNRHLIIIEDIVDSGNTIDNIIAELSDQNCTEVRIATLLFKPDSYKRQHEIHYIGFKIPNDFIVGYGLDYNGYGRNLESIYTIIND